MTPSLILIQLTYLVENADLEESDIETIGEASDPNSRAKTRRRCPLWKTTRRMGQEQYFLQPMLDSNNYFKGYIQIKRKVWKSWKKSIKGGGQHHKRKVFFFFISEDFFEKRG